MEASQLLRTTLVALATCTAALVVRADVVETKNGSKLVGKVVKVDDSTVVINTDYAGDIKVKQGDVVNITTDGDYNVRLSSGTVLQGKINGTGDGNVTIAGPDGSLNTQVSKVSTTWAPGATDPAIAALQRSWKYEVAADITGKTGNKEQLGTTLSARAILKTNQDTLQFYSAYDRQITDGTKSADQFKAGVDYQNNFAGKTSWYVRDEGGFDRVKDINLYNIAGAGLGYDFIKEPKHTLTARAGLSYRYEGYRNPATEDVNAAGLDFGLNHRYDTATWSLVNRLSYVPLFEDFGNYRIQHESYFEMPLANPAWKLRVGLSNDYNSQPGAGIDKLDTTYFTRLVLTFK